MKLSPSDCANHRIILIDDRAPIFSLFAQWSVDRRSDFLFHPDALIPLSIDDAVWPQSIAGQAGSVRVIFTVVLPTEKTVEAFLIRDINLNLTPTIQSEILSKSEFLGFDVGDEAGVSTLSNCGFDYSAEPVSARSGWAKSLNIFHLFDDLTTANHFRRFSDDRVKEHAPSQVFGVWLFRKEYYL